MVAQTRAAGQPSPTKLKFHDKLVGKGFSTDVLQKKLKSLHNELADMDQEVVDKHSLSGVRKELVNKTILLHKDRGVKAYTACCLADLLRLYAPDAPYTQDELADIFAFFFRQLSTGLKGTDSPYYNEYFHLLESLSTVKSVVLVCDLPRADDLMAEVFRSFFSMVRHDLPKKIELFMVDILIALVDECTSLPSDVLQYILDQFTDKNAQTEQPSHRLAVSLCNATADKLQQHVCQYLSTEITSHAADEEYEEVRNAHDLIKELSRSCPSLLANVIPQLEAELGTENVQIRLLATQVMGDIFAEKNGADFAKKYRSTWQVWLQRKQDKVQAVRLAFVEACKGVLTNLSDLRDHVEGALAAKILDPDEKVRTAVCKLYGQLDYETALHHVGDKQLRLLATRGIDKKRMVQVEATTTLARLYSLAYPEIENNDPKAFDHFSWIPQELLHHASVTPEIKVIVEHAIAEHILPLPSSSNAKAVDVDEVAWTDRLLFTTTLLNEQARNTLLSLSGIKTSRPSIYEKFIDSCVRNNGGVIDEDEDEVVKQLNECVKRVAASLPEPHKAVEDLHTFAKLNENRLYKLLKTCVDPQTDLKTLVKSSHEFLRRVEQSSSTIVSTMTTLLRRASLRVVNQSSVPTLMRRLQRNSESLSQADVGRSAEYWLTYISKHHPALYKLHVSELVKAIADERNAKLVEVSLQALAAVVQWDEKLIPTDKRTRERVARYVLNSDFRRAKYAARLLTQFSDKDVVCAEAVETIAESLPTADEDLLAAHTAVLSQLALRVPEAFETKSDIIMAFLLKKILMAGNKAPAEQMETDEEWIEDADLPPLLRAKIFSLKTCRNRCLAHAADEDALEVAKPVLKMFAAIIQHTGSFNADAHDDLKIKARLRLQAATSLLHLAGSPKLLAEIQQSFVPLAITIQDPCFQVRMAFIDKLLLRLTGWRLPAPYNVIPFLAVHDPEVEIINKAKAYVAFATRAIPKQDRLQRFEMIFFRLLHLLAHHPDFGITQETLPDIAKYIDFYLDLIASADNISLLFHLALKAKTVRDVESHLYSENLYAVSELAQHLIRIRAGKHLWSVESYPGKVKLPGEIVRPLPNAEAANEIVKNVYLPESTLSWLAERQKQNRADAKGKAKADRADAAERKPSVKRKAASKANGSTKRARTKGKRRKRDDSEEDEESSSSEEDDDEESGAEGHVGSSAAEEQELSEFSEPEEPTRQRLSRGARTRAKARIKQQVKKSTKSKPKAPHSED